VGGRTSGGREGCQDLFHLCKPDNDAKKKWGGKKRFSQQKTKRGRRGDSRERVKRRKSSIRGG